MALREHNLSGQTGSRRNGRFAFTRPCVTLAAFAGILALALGACGTGEASTSDAAAESDGLTVVIENLAFDPETLLRLSVEGEYVVKNLVLLAATASLALHSLAPRPREAKPLRLAKTPDSHSETATESAA